MTTITYRRAVAQALIDGLRADESVFLIGEDIGDAGGVFKLTEGVLEAIGPRRVRDTPISETAIVGTAIGAALMGLRPVAEIMFADFAGVCFDQIANQLAKFRYQTGGQVAVPVTLRLVNGGSLGFGAQHSQPVENWFLNFPGLKVAVPGTVADVYGMLRSAIRDDDPVLFFEHKALLDVKGEIASSDDGLVPLGKADIVRPGRDVTIVTTQLMRWRALAAAERLAAEGIDAEVIDLRSLVPLDLPTVLESLDRTSRLVCVQEGPQAGGWAATLVTAVMTEGWRLFDAPPLVVASDPTPIPFATALEEASMPTTTVIAARVAALVRDEHLTSLS